MKTISYQQMSVRSLELWPENYNLEKIGVLQSSVLAEEIKLRTRQRLKAADIAYQKVMVGGFGGTLRQMWEVIFPEGTTFKTIKYHTGMGYDAWAYFTTPDGRKYHEHENRLWDD